MNSIFYEFERSLKTVETSRMLYSYFINTKAPIDGSDLLRWEWVQVVSAMDRYFHNLIRYGMVLEYRGIIKRTKAYNNFPIRLKNYHAINDAENDDDVFEKIIIEKNGYKSFQTASKISEGLALIWEEPNKWNVIARKMDADSGDLLKKKIDLIVQRRNVIVHQGDFEDFISNSRKSLDVNETDEVVNFISLLGILLMQS